MEGVNVSHVALLLALALAGSAQAFHPLLSRHTRQVIHCQAGDEACQKCSTSCNSVEESRLPECCEAYNACCDHYFQACKKCSSVAAKDKYFPEYCCASFTDCCHLITTFNSPIKQPEPIKKEAKEELQIPTMPAPKPTVFPGPLAPSSVAPLAVKSTVTRAISLPQTPAPSQGSRVVVGRERVQSTTQAQNRAKSTTQPQNRAKSTTQPQNRAKQIAPPRRRPQASSGTQRSGRITSRGRLIE